MLKIFVTRRIPDIGIALLRKHKNFRVEVYKEKDPAYDTAAPIPRSVLLKKVKDAHAILCMLTEKIDAELMDAAGSQLKIVANNAVGFDNVDISEAKKRGIVVTNTPGVLNVSVAEHTIALMLALAKRIVEADTFTRAGKFKSWAPLLMIGTQLSKKTLGLVGGGRIGKMVAEFAHNGLHMNIIYTDVIRYPEMEKELGAKKVSLEALCKQADVISLHVPLLPSTHHIIDTPQLNLMKKTAL
ncbi:MAG: NAD(P)-dependent oxidoreductase, partial [Patescibacteria group bacterium]